MKLNEDIKMAIETINLVKGQIINQRHPKYEIAHEGLETALKLLESLKSKVA